RAAAAQQPAAADPWMWLGGVYLFQGQTEQVPALWDKALSLGGKLIIGVCHERGFHPCEGGDLFLEHNSVAFRIMGNEEGFSASADQVNSRGVLNNSVMGHVSFGLQLGGKNYNFDFFPLGVECHIDLLVKCPQEGIVQQLAVGNYVSQTLRKL